ncbi:MAG: DUF3795 domain-containing protein [Deltaproteobacteria bacterium]|nr:DUF3795 domain-containing protein [Deltaproteobacteria bacterium]
MIGYCGLNCSECEAYIATQNNDDAKRTDTAKQWSNRYNADIKPEDINCNGCLSENKKRFFYCENRCEIRKCCVSKKITSCAVCPDYKCKLLMDFIKQAPECGEALERLRA